VKCFGGVLEHPRDSKAWARFGLLTPTPGGGWAQPPLSPAGWYWQGTTEERGIWRKGGPYPSAVSARDACIAAFARGAYLLND
jgi:hypothetical protein